MNLPPGAGPPRCSGGAVVAEPSTLAGSGPAKPGIRHDSLEACQVLHEIHGSSDRTRGSSAECWVFQVARPRGLAGRVKLGRGRPVVGRLVAEKVGRVAPEGSEARGARSGGAWRAERWRAERWRVARGAVARGAVGRARRGGGRGARRDGTGSRRHGRHRGRARGRRHYSDARVKNFVRYRYTVTPVDQARNVTVRMARRCPDRVCSRRR
jgi:hypothetical protein